MHDLIIATSPQKSFRRACCPAAWVLLIVLAAVGCGGPQGPKTLEGAWLGMGEFHGGPGSMAVKAQLEILSGGSYRFLIIEPGILALAGMETGTWTRTGERVDLEPAKEEYDPDRGGILRGAPRNFRPKSLTIEGEFDSLLLQDGPLHLEFEPNPEATEKLRANGEVE